MNDTLFLNINEVDISDNSVTKILSAAHKVFDPLGWACPVLLRPKLMLQSLWNQKIDWDSEVPKQIMTEFKEWQAQVQTLREIKVPRWIFGEETDQITLHMFDFSSE